LVEIGAPFNPYRIFQGAFAPFWLIEHNELGAGAKLCYIRLLGFAGRDGHCYPSLERLGASLGVSERQARAYVRELQHAGLIAVEQRGLRRTNVYLFIWTAELASLNDFSHAKLGSDPDGGFVPPSTVDSNEVPSGSDWNNSSGQDRNLKTTGRDMRMRRARPGLAVSRNSGVTNYPERKHPSTLDRKWSADPIGKQSGGKHSSESSTSLAVSTPAISAMKTTECGSNTETPPIQTVTGTALTVIEWAREKGLRRRRSDGTVGPPEQDVIEQWVEILDELCPPNCSPREWVRLVVEDARAAADGIAEWRNWTF
jgi:hypothetical protein